MSEYAARPCSVVDQHCRAPANGETNTRGTCVMCLEPVCPNCSLVLDVPPSEHTWVWDTSGRHCAPCIADGARQRDEFWVEARARYVRRWHRLSGYRVKLSQARVIAAEWYDGVTPTGRQHATIAAVINAELDANGIDPVADGALADAVTAALGSLGLFVRRIGS